MVCVSFLDDRSAEARRAEAEAGAEAASHIALGDAVAFAEIIEVSVDDAVHVAERMRISGEALLCV